MAEDDNSNGVERNAKSAEDVGAVRCVGYAGGAFNFESIDDVDDCVGRMTE